MPAFSYRAFGLNICSEIECVGALPAVGAPDVFVRLGSVPERLHNARTAGIFYEANPGVLLLNIKHAGRFLISGGNEILIDPTPGADEGAIFLMLFGSAFGALLHQRQVVVLHGSAIMTACGAVVFAGASGYGKSTLAFVLHERGHAILADDLCPIRTNDHPTVLPANPYVMLWADSTKRLGAQQSNLRRVRSGLEKYIVPLGEDFVPDPVRLHAVYVLGFSESGRFDLVPAQGLARIRTLNSVIYRPEFVDGMGLASQCSRQLGYLAQRTKVAIVNRPRQGFRVEELADLVAADFAA